MTFVPSSSVILWISKIMDKEEDFIINKGWLCSFCRMDPVNYLNVRVSSVFLS